LRRSLPGSNCVTKRMGEEHTGGNAKEQLLHSNHRRKGRGSVGFRKMTRRQRQPRPFFPGPLSSYGRGTESEGERRSRKSRKKEVRRNPDSGRKRTLPGFLCGVHDQNTCSERRIPDAGSMMGNGKGAIGDCYLPCKTKKSVERGGKRQSFASVNMRELGKGEDGMDEVDIS